MMMVRGLQNRDGDVARPRGRRAGSNMNDLRVIIFIAALLWSSAVVVWAFVPFTPQSSRTGLYRSSSSSPVILQGWFDDRQPSKKPSVLPQVGLDLKVERPKGYQWKLELTVDFPARTGGAVQSRREGPAIERKSRQRQGLPKSPGLEWFKRPTPQSQRKVQLQRRGAAAGRRTESPFLQRSRGKSSRRREPSGRSQSPVVLLPSILPMPNKKKMDRDRRPSRITRRKSSSRYGTTNRLKSQPSSWGVLLLDRLPKLDVPPSLKPIEWPTVELPKLDFDRLKSVEWPKVDLPKVELPKLDLPKLDFDRLKSVEWPNVELPQLDLFDFDRAGPRAPARRKRPVRPKKPVRPKTPPPLKFRDRQSSWGVLPKLDLPKLDLSSLKPIQLPTVELPKWELDLKSIELPKVDLPKVDLPKLDLLFDFDRAAPRAAPAKRKKPVPPKAPPPIRSSEKQARVVVRQALVKRSQTTSSKTKTVKLRNNKVKQQPKYNPLKVQRRRKRKRGKRVKYDLDRQSLEQDLARFVQDPSSSFWLD